MNKLIMSVIYLLLIFFISCSPPEGRLRPSEQPNVSLGSTYYRNDTAEIKTVDAQISIVGQWSEKGGYSFEITIANLSDKEETIDFDYVKLSGNRLESAEIYLRRNGTEDPFSSAQDADDNIVRLKPREKRTVFAQFKQQMKKEQYFALGRKGDNVQLDLLSQMFEQTNVGFEAIFSYEMEDVTQKSQRNANY